MTNADQNEFWSDSAGPVWVSMQIQMDALLKPIQDVLLATAALQPGERVLDVGCGTGASTAAAADIVGMSGHVTGTDFSEIMLDHARLRYKACANTTWLTADAQSYKFQQSAFDVILSRLGVMFFDDSVAALINLKKCLAPKGRMVFAAWGPAWDNPWFTEASRAAVDVLGPVPKADRTLPGPFAFEDVPRVREFMIAAGLGDIKTRSIELALTPLGNLTSVAELCCRIGPADSALQYHGASDKQRIAVADAIVDRFAKFCTPGGLRIPAVINLIEVRARQ